MKFLVRGYHGTTRAVAQVILREGFDTGRGEAGWFGVGAYFFEENPSQAARWPPGCPPDRRVVLRAQLDLTEHGLDLTNESSRKAFRDLALDVIRKIRAADGPLPLDRDGFGLDAVVIDLLSRVTGARWVRVLAPVGHRGSIDFREKGV